MIVLRNKVEMTKKRWREVLSRAIDVTLLLVKQDHAFRGHFE